MGNTAEYRRRLAPRVALHARLVTDAGRLTSYALVLLSRESAGDWRAVRVFDNAHGRHEMHRYTRDGEKRTGERFHDGTPSEAMNAALRWVEEGWEEMVEAWRS